MKPWAEKFYSSEAWKTTRESFLLSKNFLCERCSTDSNPVPATIAHHKIWLTKQNINDPAVALSHSNLEALCQDCHNKEHHRTQKLCYRFDANGNILPSPPHQKVKREGENTEGRANEKLRRGAHRGCGSEG